LPGRACGEVGDLELLGEAQAVNRSARMSVIA
jgi:hypothetical protein